MSYTAGAFVQQARQVLVEDSEGAPPNTSRAYDGKRENFLAFCQHKYADDPVFNPYTVTEDKMFGFLFYQSRRPKRPPGTKDKFNAAEFDEYIADASKIATNPPAYSVINQFRSTILKLWHEQVDAGTNNQTKDQIMSGRIKRLLDNVKKRRVRISKQNFEEKLTQELSPYQTVEDLPRLENFFFDKNKTNCVYAMSSLRDRYCVLMTTMAILRGESLFLADLSDYCDFSYTPNGHVGEVLVHIMRVATGKTNGLRTLYGRCVRTKDVFLCPQGALGLYLLSRFSIMDELDGVDWTDNKSWFNIKLLVDCRGHNTEGMTDRSYGSSMRDACKKMGISSRHFIHFGRGAGAVKAELEELGGYEIDELGNWNNNERRNVYSTKIPMKSMRVIAGHSEYKGCMHLPRGEVTPPQELLEQIFPFVEGAEEQVVSSSQSHETAAAFLKFLRRLRMVILQDVAAMQILGRTHKLFELPVFQSQEFHEFRDRLRSHVLVSEEPINAKIEQILPSVCSRLTEIQRSLTAGFGEVRETQLRPSHVRDLLAHVFRAASTFDFNRPAISDAAVNQNERSEGFDAFPEPDNMAEVALLHGGNERELQETQGGQLVPQYKVFRKHKTIYSVWDEWNGLRDFSSDINDDCHVGGIKELERLHKNRWRVSYSPADAKYFSRVKSIVMMMECMVEASSLGEVEVINELNEVLQREEINQITKIEKRFRQELELRGLEIRTKRRRRS